MPPPSVRSGGRVLPSSVEVKRMCAAGGPSGTRKVLEREGTDATHPVQLEQRRLFLRAAAVWGAWRQGRAMDAAVECPGGVREAAGSPDDRRRLRHGDRRDAGP